MATICPTVLASTKADFKVGMQNIAFASRIQIDLADGLFAQPATIGIDKVHWTKGQKADIHLMYDDPAFHVDELAQMQPHMIILHAEAATFYEAFDRVVNSDCKTGIAILPETDPDDIADQLVESDHCLIFGGNLGSYGGKADLSQLNKVKKIRDIHSTIEIGWDGGANDSTAQKLAEGGIDVINVGSFIQKSSQPQEAYATLTHIVGGKNDN